SSRAQILKGNKMEMTLEKIKFKTTDEKPCLLTLAVQIPSEILEAKKEEVTGEFQKVVQLPGFRAGKVPVDLVKRNFSEKIRGEVLEQVLKESVSQIIKEKELAPVSTPMVDKIEYNDKSLKFNLL